MGAGELHTHTLPLANTLCSRLVYGALVCFGLLIAAARAARLLALACTKRRLRDSAARAALSPNGPRVAPVRCGVTDTAAGGPLPADTPLSGPSHPCPCCESPLGPPASGSASSSGSGSERSCVSSWSGQER